MPSVLIEALMHGSVFVGGLHMTRLAPKRSGSRIVVFMPKARMSGLDSRRGADPAATTMTNSL